MAEIARSIFAQLPWLKVFLVWALAATVVILALSLPAYFLFLPLAQRLRAELKQYLAAARERHCQQRSQRNDAQRELVAQYAQDRLLRHIDSANSKQWARTREALLHSSNEIEARLADVTGRMGGFTHALPQLHDRIQAITDAMPQDFHLTTDSLTQATGTLRVARMGLTACGLLLVAIITVNTGMLSQIVRDFGFIPPSLKFLNVPLYNILALLITCVEAGFGIIHGNRADADMSEERGKIRPGAALASVGAFGIAIVEGFFYSRIDPDRTRLVNIPLTGFSLPETDIFFIWGFLLVMALFGLGLTCYQMSAKILRGTALTTLRKQMRIFNKEALKCSGALQKVQGMATSARAAAANGQGAAVPTPFAGEAVERLLAELHKLLQASPPWADIMERPLGAPEVLDLAAHALLWFLAAAAASAIATSTGVTTLSRLAPDIANPIVLALGQVALFGIAGFLVGWGETVVQGHDWQKVTASSWGRPAGVALLGLGVVAYLLLAVDAYSAGIVLPWTANLLVCLVVSAACYQLIPLLGLARIWTRRARDLLASASERIYRCLVATVLFLTAILDELISIPAGPFLVLKRHRETNNPRR